MAVDRLYNMSIWAAAPDFFLAKSDKIKNKYCIFINYRVSLKTKKIYKAILRTKMFPKFFGTFFICKENYERKQKDE